jgi:hypothetical protein
MGIGERNGMCPGFSQREFVTDKQAVEKLF